MSSVPVALDHHAGDRGVPAPIARAARAVRGIPPRAALACLLALAFLGLTGAVVGGSDVDGADTLVLRWAASSPWPWLHGGASAWVLLGQRAECLVIAAVWFTVRAVRRREIRPLLTLGVVTLLLDASVGLVKMAVGRLGPLELHAAALDTGGSRVFTGRHHLPVRSHGQRRGHLRPDGPARHAAPPAGCRDRRLRRPDRAVLPVLRAADARTCTGRRADGRTPP